jgi:hypothetical protein
MFTNKQYLFIRIMIYRASHIRLISEFILYATENTNVDHLILDDRYVIWLKMSK